MDSEIEMKYNENKLTMKNIMDMKCMRLKQCNQLLLTT